MAEQQLLFTYRKLRLYVKTYEISSSVGDVTIGDESMSGFGKKRRIDNNSDNLLDIKCDVGDITIDFVEY
ncbi:MAG TPA: hypothetical protein DEG06_10790 [Lachnospiraceae bacterium]|nr:hypothetical protein [Lachnospiraceae bacterium]HCM11859.1 hypothetical protein [Lachnospiraceae bacterium]